MFGRSPQHLSAGRYNTLQPQQHRGDPRKRNGDIRLNDLVIALGTEIVPCDLLFAAGAGVGTVGNSTLSMHDRSSSRNRSTNGKDRYSDSGERRLADEVASQFACLVIRRA